MLLHATLSSGRQLRALATKLAARFTVLSVDRRGSGDSSAAAPSPVRPIDVEVHIDDLVAIAAEEGLKGSVVVGHSYGGCVALELAARRPGLVSAVFAYEPPYAPVAPPAAQRDMLQVGRRTLQAGEQGSLAEAALAFMAGVSGDAAVQALSPSARERIGRAGTGAVADATLSGMDPQALAAITCPTMIATGGDSDGVYADIADALVDRVAGAHHRRIPAADHMAPITRPDVVAAAVQDFTGP
jgi:pimeloyl-ACP methyl ester carboxylesterase